MSRFLQVPPLDIVDYSYKFPFSETYQVLKGRQDEIDKHADEGYAGLDLLMKAEVDPHLIPWKNQKILDYKGRLDEANELIYKDPSNMYAYNKAIRGTVRDMMTDEGIQKATMDYKFIKSEQEASAKSTVAEHNNKFNQNYNQYWKDNEFLSNNPSTGNPNYGMFSQKYDKNIYADVDLPKLYESKIDGVGEDAWKGWKEVSDGKGNKYIATSEGSSVSKGKLLGVMNAAQQEIWGDSKAIREATNQLEYAGIEADEANLKAYLGEVSIDAKGRLTVTPNSMAERAVLEKIKGSSGSDLKGYPGWDYNKEEVTPAGDNIVTLPSQPNDKFSSSQVGKDITLDEKGNPKSNKKYVGTYRSEYGFYKTPEMKAEDEAKRKQSEIPTEEHDNLLYNTRATIAQQFTTKENILLPGDITNAQAKKIIEEIFDPKDKDEDNLTSLRTYNPKLLEYKYSPEKKYNVQQQRTEEVLGTSYSSGDVYTREVVAPFAIKDASATNVPQSASNVLNDNNHITAFQKSQSAVVGIVSPVNPYEGLYIGETISVPDAKDAEDMKSDAGIKYMYALPNQSKITPADRMMYTEFHNAVQGMFNDEFTKQVGPYNGVIPDDRLMQAANTPNEVDMILLNAVGDNFSNIPEGIRGDVTNALSKGEIYYAVTPKPVIRKNLEANSDSPERYSFNKEMGGDVYAYYKTDDNQYHPIMSTPISDVNTLEQIYLSKAKQIFIK